MSSNCLSNILKVICTLQNNSTNIEGNSFRSIYNTRVISLYNCNSSLIKASYKDNIGTTFSTTFYRVTSVYNNCCKLLLLKFDNTNNTYISTHEYITVNLDCIGAVRCISDVTVNNL